MVKKGEFIQFASLKDVKNDYSTEFQVVIELSKKIEDLELRVKKLEEVK